MVRATVSRYLALGMLPAVQLPGKNLFRKTDLDKILNLETGVTRLKGEVSGIDTDTSNLTTIDRASKYYGASAVTMLKILNDRGILPIVFAGINYFKKDDIRRIFGSSPLKDTVKTQQWVTHEQIELEYRMTYTAVTRLLRELKIPSKRVNRVTYYSMDHLKARKKEMDAAFSELYYTVPQINEKYHLYGKSRAILDGYKDIYTHKLESVGNTDLHFWYGTKESLRLDSTAHIEVFSGMNHGQLLVDRPEDVGLRIDTICGIL